MHAPCRPKPYRRAGAGFTLIEVMVTVAIVGILSAVAMPSYTAYVQRSKVPAGLDALQSYFSRMEQRFQDAGTYANGAVCAIALPTVQNFSMSCTLAGGGTGYAATATGTGTLTGFAYVIDSSGMRRTAAHPKGAPATCWSIKGGTCDT